MKHDSQAFKHYTQKYTTCSRPDFNTDTLFKTRHKNRFNNCQKFRVTRCTILIFSAFLYFQFRNLLSRIAENIGIELYFETQEPIMRTSAYIRNS
jgi:hypothetical protein